MQLFYWSSVVTVHFNNVLVVHISFILLSSHKPCVVIKGVYRPLLGVYTPGGPVAIIHLGVQLPTGYSCTVAT